MGFLVLCWCPVFPAGTLQSLTPFLYFFCSTFFYLLETVLYICLCAVLFYTIKVDVALVGFAEALENKSVTTDSIYSLLGTRNTRELRTTINGRD